MAYVESDIELYYNVMSVSDNLDQFYRVFKATVDTINVHGGNTGYTMVHCTRTECVGT